MRHWIATHRLEACLLLLLFALGAYLRCARLTTTTGFAGDQGEYYLAVMRWVKLGEWPLIGQRRADGSADCNIHPGFFYTIAPALALTDCNPAAGAATQITFVLTGYALGWWWMRRAARSGWPALFAISVPLLAPVDIEATRSLWNPYFLMFALPALLCAMRCGARRPFAALACIAILALWMPGWHTTAFPVLGIGIGFWLVLARRWKHRILFTPTRTKLTWAAALLATILLLFIPPLLYELRPGPGNLLPYLANTLRPAPHSDYTLAYRMQLLLDVNQLVYAHHYYSFLPATVSLYPLRYALGIVWFALCIGVLRQRRGALRRARPVDLGALMLLALVLGFAVLQVKLGEYYLTYYHTAVLLAPVLLAGWAVGTAGRLHAQGRLSRRTQIFFVACGLVLWLPAAVQWPAALRLPQTYSGNLVASEAIARYIQRDAHGAPYSLGLLERINWREYLHALLWRTGPPPQNSDMSHTDVRAEEFGECLYLVVRGTARTYPNDVKGITLATFEPVPVADATVLKLPRNALPPRFKRIELDCSYEKEINTIRVITD